MRSLAVAILTIGTVWAAEPARAQKYDPDFPFCMHVVKAGGVRFEDCTYYTLAQCKASTYGGSCDPNPFFAGAPASPGRYNRMRRNVY